MSIRTIPFECGGLWNESFPELLVQSCTVDPATHRLGPTRRWAVIVCNLYSRMELSFSETVCCNICFIFKTVHCASFSAFLPFFFHLLGLALESRQGPRRIGLVHWARVGLLG